MPKTKHTPEWKVRREVVDDAEDGEFGNIYEYHIQSSTDGVIAITYDANHASLIAAIPKLLEACKRALDYLDSEEGTEARGMRRFLEAAIKEAVD